ncbi:hypothetical protein N7E02_14180 [Aliirhizobium terrae]|uniref:hypothetical protein n=1 Tax=Terrirhizobium terrae TaxID=2926709 RepID=UPI002577EB94|nr:hypothetical protein [Rhizobium sp. CC-CFT758]WJH41508.1 hypothetical protein N7E02_14180 [Rhizobium sp. CC-CFT758]
MKPSVPMANVPRARNQAGSMDVSRCAGWFGSNEPVVLGAIFCSIAASGVRDDRLPGGRFRGLCLIKALEGAWPWWWPRGQWIFIE